MLCSSSATLARLGCAQKTWILCHILLGNLWWVICPLALSSPVLHSSPLWNNPDVVIKVKSTAHWGCTASADTDQGPGLSGLLLRVQLATFMSCWPRTSIWSPASHLQWSWTETQTHWEPDSSHGFGTDTRKDTSWGLVLKFCSYYTGYPFMILKWRPEWILKVAEQLNSRVNEKIDKMVHR